MKKHDSLIKFMKKLRDGKYPFTAKHESNTSKTYYILNFRSMQAFFCLGVSIACFLVFLFCCIFYDYKSKINTLFIVLFIIFFALAIKRGTYHELKIITDLADQSKNNWEYKKYFFFIKQIELTKKKMDEIYIRILKAKGYKKQDQYYLVIGGNGISPIPISSASYNLDLIRSIGQKISTISNVELNFFDVEDFPRYHTIVYDPPTNKS